MLKDRTSLYLCIILMSSFIVISIIDVSGIYPLMNNIAVITILVLVFLFIMGNAFICSNLKETETKLPESEDETPEFRQL